MSYIGIFFESLNKRKLCGINQSHYISGVVIVRKVVIADSFSVFITPSELIMNREKPI